MKPEASARLLPEVIRQGMGPGQLLDGLLASMAELHRPCEDILDRLQAICDPRAVPERLLPFLALATGITGYRIEEQVRDDQGAIRPFHLRLIAPAAARRQHELVLLVLRMAKPAHVTCDLLFA